MSRNRRTTPRREPSEWNFNSFPTYFALSAGLLLGIVVDTFLSAFTGPFGAVPFALFIISLFGFSYGTIHIITHALIRKRQSRAQSRAEEDERERRIYIARAAAQAENPPPPRKRRRRR